MLSALLEKKTASTSVILDSIIVLNFVLFRTQFLTKFSKENVLAIDSHIYFYTKHKK